MHKYEVGDKFVIEVSEIIENETSHVGPYYKIKGFNNFVIDETHLNGLDMYQETSIEAVDWSKVEVDTPILVRRPFDEDWHKRYFAEYRDGGVYAWNGGATSWTTAWKDNVSQWEYAKLAEVE